MAALPLREVWKAAERAVIAGDVAALEQLLRAHPRLAGGAPPYVPSGPGPHYTGAAQSIVAREQHFESYARFVEHREALQQQDTPVARFEAAVEAVISGDLVALKQLLHSDPGLIRARSTRTHHSTLLHYVGANGIEGFRQKTPPNAVQITELLLEAGAEVDAPADMYGGGSTTLGLVATSIHPWLAGVQNALLDILLNHGAANGGISGCLANGRGEAAEFLAGRGAVLSLAEAAGVGRLDVVQSCFNENGSLQANATTEQLKSGFGWACQYGRTSVVRFLLERAKDLRATLSRAGPTGLHWAAYGGHADTVELLLAHQATVNAKDKRFGGTPLGWAVYGWGERGATAKSGRYYEVVAFLVTAGAMVDPAWLNEEDRGIPLEQMIRDDPRMRAALGGVV